MNIIIEQIILMQYSIKIIFITNYIYIMLTTNRYNLCVTVHFLKNNKAILNALKKYLCCPFNREFDEWVVSNSF